MKKISAILLTLTFLVSAAASFAQTKVSAARQTNDLVSQLPAADGVVQINTKRLLDEALPVILAEKPTELAKITGFIDELKAKTGLDARQFERVAIGMKFVQVRGKEIDVDPVILAQGSFNAGAMIAVGKLAANGKYREEKVGGKTVYVFSVKEVAGEAQKNLPGDKNADKAMKLGSRLLSGEIAAVAVNTNTLALGKPAQLRAMLLPANSRNKVSADLVGLINRNQNAVVSFAGTVPAFTATMLDLKNDEFGRILASLRQISGAMDVAGTDMTMLLAARTDSPAQAEKLEETLLGLQMLGTSIFSSSGKEKDKALLRMIETLKIARNANEVQLNATLPQIELSKFIGELK